ncbi:MAG: hypothetical protein JKY54_00890 [Flavobacteriales bacterium]|nr:hypothetical protein [Flavobacteriales bacterium]
MSNDYLYSCPSCSAGLSKDGKIMVTMSLDSGEKSNLILDPQLGNYNYTCNPPLSLKDGEFVNCFCPYCWESLQSENYPNFVRLGLVKPGEELVTVLFSRLVGQRKTYIVNNKFTEEFGDGSKSLLDFAS